MTTYPPMQFAVADRMEILLGGTARWMVGFYIFCFVFMILVFGGGTNRAFTSSNPEMGYFCLVLLLGLLASGVVVFKFVAKDFAVNAISRQGIEVAGQGFKSFEDATKIKVRGLPIAPIVNVHFKGGFVFSSGGLLALSYPRLGDFVLDFILRSAKRDHLFLEINEQLRVDHRSMIVGMAILGTIGPILVLTVFETIAPISAAVILASPYLVVAYRWMRPPKPFESF